ncbi:MULTISPECIES: hypothetical protein [unclassified Rhodococcus (in: high G+C Gram-positive bacteria)]|uniref:hypothetical protein n=1 Tax=unclassified Rhodococcus (in: high G+C Gram-positive bacteria) TaxID=192944 RepID=UPI0024B77A8E|nr:MULTISPECIES: hypothetical protein [unclassified Rhodococcus (in: high G+C Gram-positive bacteria)]MDI9950659.1 hypothetical protein [Rhodococcus sp. IEGM 1305]MDI9972730.1 hypothetical protein [Rhodococcus sp. IEGM 1307]
MSSLSEAARRSGRARGSAAAVVGFFAAGWFGWAMAVDLRRPLTVLLDAAIVVALVVAVLGAVLAVRSPAESSALADRAVRRRYTLVVVVEFAVIWAGAAVLGNTGLSAWIPVWVCFAVGVHFVPLAGVLGESSLTVLGALLVVVAAAGLVVGLTTTVAPGTVTGIGAGGCLLAAAVLTLAGKRFSGRRTPGPVDQRGSEDSASPAGAPRRRNHS